MTDAEPAPSSRFARFNRRNLIVAVVVWIALVGGALGIAAALDTQPKPVESAIPEDLPPLRLYLERPMPAAVAREKNLEDQVLKLREIANLDSTPENWTNLGAAYHYAGALRDAAMAYQRALSIDDDRLDARVGVLLLDASLAGQEGMDRANTALRDLATANPTNQMVAFNQAMLAIYRGDREALVADLDRTIALGKTTRLGRQAEQLRKVAAP